jgi:HEPN domain-containing protein
MIKLVNLLPGNTIRNSKLKEERQIRIYDKVTDMVPGLEEYMDKLNFKPITWRKQLVNILEKDTGYQNMVINLTNFTDSIKNELSLIEEFRDTIRGIMEEYEQIELEKRYLSPKDMDAVTELDNIYYKLKDAENQLEEYVDNLKQIIESYETLEHTVRYTVKFDLNI